MIPVEKNREINPQLKFSTKYDIVMNGFTIPNRYKAEIGDRWVYGNKDLSDLLLHCIIEFDRKIDENLLQRAVRLSLDAEPIMGCYLRKGFWNISWHRRSDLDIIQFCKTVITENSEVELNDFLIKKIDPAMDPLIELLVIRNDKDILCIKTHHNVMDLGGFKYYIYLLSDIYCKLQYDQKYIPPVNRKKFRGWKQVAKYLTIYDKILVLRRMYRNIKISFKAGTFCSFPVVESRSEEKEFVIRHISKDRFRAIALYGKTKGATINDMMLAIFIHACIRLLEPDINKTIGIASTVDYRNYYIPSDEIKSISNLSGFTHINVFLNKVDSFDNILAQVRDQMNILKNDYIGLVCLPLQKPLEWIPISLVVKYINSLTKHAIKIYNKKRKCLYPLVITNAGFIETNKLFFQNAGVLNAYILSPLYYNGYFFCISGCNEGLTISAGVNDPEKYKFQINSLFDLMEDEIVKIFDKFNIN